MTLTAHRDSTDIAFAVAAAIKLVGAGRLSEAVDRSENSVRAWGNQNREPRSYPDVLAIQAMDDLCMRKSGKAPFAGWLECRKDANRRSNTDLFTDALETGEATGQLQKEIASALDPNGDGGKNLTHRERERLLEKIANLEGYTERMRSAVLDADGTHE